jgi:hypothetical protein
MKVIASRPAITALDLSECEHTVRRATFSAVPLPCLNAQHLRVDELAGNFHPHEFVIYSEHHQCQIGS